MLPLGLVCYHWDITSGTSMLPLGCCHWDWCVTTGTRMLPLGQVCYHCDGYITTGTGMLPLRHYQWDWYVTTGRLPLGLVRYHLHIYIAHSWSDRLLFVCVRINKQREWPFTMCMRSCKNKYVCVCSCVCAHVCMWCTCMHVHVYACVHAWSGKMWTASELQISSCTK